MRFTEFKLITEGVAAMQEINRMSQEIVNYFNQRPELVKSGTRVPLDKIIPGGSKDPALDVTIRAVEIVIKPMKEFEQDRNGRWVNKMAQGSYNRVFADPKQINPLTGEPVSQTSQGADSWARTDRHWSKTAHPQDTIPYHIDQGHKTTINLPAEILTRSFETTPSPDGVKPNPRSIQQTTTGYARGILSTIVHEFNHAYNSFQGMDFESYRRKVDKNRTIADKQNDIRNLLANAEDEAFLNKNIGIIKDAPQELKDLYFNSRELAGSKTAFQQYERAMDGLEKTILQLEQKIAGGSATATEVQQLERYKTQLEILKTQVTGLRTDVKRYSAKQKQLKQRLANLKVDPKLPISYDDDAYYTNPVELNSRLQQVSLDMAKEIKPGMSNQAIVEMIQRAFGNHQITVEFIDPDLMKSYFKPGTTVADREFKQLIQKSQDWEKTSPKFKQEAWASAMSKPEFKRYVSIAYKFVQAEIANPASLVKTSEATLGQKLKAALTGIPQGEINSTILPSATNAMASGARQAVTPGSPLRQNMVAATVEASKKLDTPGALKALSISGKVLIAAGVVVEIYRGFDQIKALPDDMPDEEYKQQVQMIIAKLVAEFGLVFVGALAGAWASGAVLSAILPGLGTVAGAVVGFIAGGAAGYLALEFAGDSVASITEFIVKELRGNKQPKITSKQGQSSLPRSDTSQLNPNTLLPTNQPKSPISKPEPAWESLDRIIELAVVKKPT
jgi:hypothetical protein